MILKKPFSFLIKHFKLIHLGLLFILAYIMYSTNSILMFFNEYLEGTPSLINHSVSESLYNVWVYLAIFAVYLISIIVLGLMFVKKKPIQFYIYLLISYIYVIAMFSVTRGIVTELEVGLVAVKTLKLIRDLTLISVIVQSVFVLFVVIRATGFDIKKFNFVKDLEELEIKDVDSEEFEVNLSFDNDKFLMKVRSFFRHFKYVYYENKYVFLFLGVIIAGIISAVIYLNVGVYNKMYEENTSFSTSEFVMKINDTYYTKYDYKQNILENDYQFLVVPISLKTLGSKDKDFNIGLLQLKINDNYFYHTTDYLKSFSDIGELYVNDEITNDLTTYLFVFKIPISYTDDEMILTYFDVNGKEIKINVSPESLNGVKDNGEFDLTKGINLYGSIFNNSSILLESYELSSNFKEYYNYCYKGECKESYLYMKADLDSNYDKSLLKLKGSVSYDPELEIEKESGLFSFLNRYAKLIYTIGNTEYETGFTDYKYNSKLGNTYTYIEVPSSVEQADSILIKIVIRNNVYYYKLK